MSLVYDTPEMLASAMERDQHRAGLFQSIFTTGPAAGNEDIVVIDISYWQDHTLIDYDVLSANINGVILRGTYGIWKDTRFDIHYDNFHKRGVPIGSYAYLIGNYTGKQQADVFRDATKGREFKLEVYADVEDKRPGTALTRPVADDFIANTDKSFSLLTSIYTGPYAWRAIMGWTNPSHKHRKLWIANYQVRSPMLPIGGGWTDWWLWQYSDKGRVTGYDRSIDVNRFSKSTQIWNSWVGETKPIIPPPPEPPITGGKYKLELLGSLFIRNRPISGDRIGSVSKGEVYYSSEIQNGWYKITKGNVTGWISGAPQYVHITIVVPDEVPSSEIEAIKARLDKLEDKVFGK